MRGDGIVPVMEVGTNNGNSGFGNGDWSAWIIIFLIFALGGWGNNNGFGGNRGNGSVADNYILASDFATIQRQLSDGFGDLTAQSRYIQNGLCDGFYAMNTSLLNGFAGVNNSIMTNGYETRNAINNVSSQLADCCCTIERGIDGINYNNAINTNNLSRQISDCCCNLEKMNMQNRFDAQTYNCNTLQAIDKLGDRIIDRLTQDKIETLTSENQALRLKASQSAQNAYLLNELKPCPSPSYIVPNPNCCYNYSINGVGYGNCCGCNNY